MERLRRRRGRVTASMRSQTSYHKEQPVVTKLENFDVAKLVQNFKKQKDNKEYMQVLSELQQHPNDFTLLVSWIVKLTDCIPFEKKATGLFLDFMDIPWMHGKNEVIEAYNNFILCIVTAHSNLAIAIIEKLFKLLIPAVASFAEENFRTNPAFIDQSALNGYFNVCKLITAIATKVPLVRKEVITSATKVKPYFGMHFHVHVVYVYNMLCLSEMMPTLRSKFLEIIIINMIDIDSNIIRIELEESSTSVTDDEEMFRMELDLPEEATEENLIPQFTEHKLGKTCDILMTIMIRYIHSTVHGSCKIAPLFQLDAPFSVNNCHVGSRACSDKDKKQLNQGCECKRLKHNNQMAAELYVDLKDIFLSYILPTYSPSHVQYLVFYILAIRPPLISDFLDVLKTVFQATSNLVLRRNAISYLGSLLVRGSFVTFSHVCSTMEIVYDWCKRYMNTKLEHDAINYEYMWVHAPFYFACQILFYVFNFRYKEFIAGNTENSISCLQFDHLVHSKLNPLDHCMPEVVEKFAAISYYYQVAYCYGIMENNKRQSLPEVRQEKNKFVPEMKADQMFFPFEPYMLLSSKRYIKNHYSDLVAISEEIVQQKPPASGNTSIACEDYSGIDQQLFNISSHSLDNSFEQSPCL